MNKLVKSILIFEAALLIGPGAFGFFGYVTNGYESVAPLYIKTDDGLIRAALSAPENEQVDVQVKAAGFKKHPEYIVNITPNAEYDFTFRADGTIYKFSQIKNLNEQFELNLGECKFSLCCKSIPELLSSYFDGAEIEVDESFKPKTNYFNLTYQTADGGYKNTVGLQFTETEDEEAL